MQKYCCDTTELRKAMADAGLNKIGEVSKKSGINRNTLGKVLSGQELPSSMVMYGLVEALNLSPTRAGIIFFKPNLRNT